MIDIGKRPWRDDWSAYIAYADQLEENHDDRGPEAARARYRGEVLRLVAETVGRVLRTRSAWSCVLPCGGKVMVKWGPERLDVHLRLRWPRKGYQSGPLSYLPRRLLQSDPTFLPHKVRACWGDTRR